MQGVSSLFIYDLNSNQTQLDLFDMSTYNQSGVLQIIVWDALTATEATRLWLNHIGPPLWIEHSPVEVAFASCGSDRSVRFWKVM